MTIRLFYRILLGVALLICILSALGCQPADPMDSFVKQQESLPPDQRVPDWEKTKTLMSRRAPAVGEAAPDFTLATLEGSRTIRRSAFHESRPLVLLFGSFT
ncbi:MAG TPA: hypothetical protein VNT79_03520 [Phycisphaerae bacterium]|nr:hypothetical protein [Phycisphaerae bacterium]